MIYEGTIEYYNIKDWFKDHTGCNNNHQLRDLALNSNLFKFSRKYLLFETYEEFVNIRKNEIIEEKTKDKKIKLSFFIKLTLTKQDLAFKEESYQHSAMTTYFSFLHRIIRDSEKNDNRTFGKDSFYFENAHRNFYHHCSFIDEKTFYIIKKHAEIYFDWIKEQLETNSKLNIQEKIKDF